jgi:hypothetical protein
VEWRAISSSRADIYVASASLQAAESRLAPAAPYRIDDQIHRAADRLELLREWHVVEQDDTVYGRELGQSVGIAPGRDDSLRAGQPRELEDALPNGPVAPRTRTLSFACNAALRRARSAPVPTTRTAGGGDSAVQAVRNRGTHGTVGQLEVSQPAPPLAPGTRPAAAAARTRVPRSGPSMIVPRWAMGRRAFLRGARHRRPRSVQPSSLYVLSKKGCWLRLADRLAGAKC